MVVAVMYRDVLHIEQGWSTDPNTKPRITVTCLLDSKPKLDYLTARNFRDKINSIMSLSFLRKL